MAKVIGLNTWLNRTTRRFLSGVSSGGMARAFPTETFDDGAGTPTSNAKWIHAPDMSAVVGQPDKYWVITGDVVSLMDAAARAVEDAAIVDAIRDTTVAQLDRQEDVMRAFMLVVLDQFNTLRALHSLPDATPAQLRNAVRGKLGS